MPMGKNFRRRHRRMLDGMRRELNPGDQRQTRADTAPIDNGAEPSIEPQLKPVLHMPAQLKPDLHKTDNDPPLWLAIWNPRRSVAYAVDVSMAEIRPYERALKSTGNNVAGPFTTQRQAQNFAIARLRAARAHRPE